MSSVHRRSPLTCIPTVYTHVWCILRYHTMSVPSLYHLFHLCTISLPSLCHLFFITSVPSLHHLFNIFLLSLYCLFTIAVLSLHHLCAVLCQLESHFHFHRTWSIIIITTMMTYLKSMIPSRKSYIGARPIV